MVSEYKHVPSNGNLKVHQHNSKQYRSPNRNYYLGVIFMVLATLSYTTMNILVKITYASNPKISAYEVAFSRGFLGLLLFSGKLTDFIIFMNFYFLV